MTRYNQTTVQSYLWNVFAQDLVLKLVRNLFFGPLMRVMASCPFQHGSDVDVWSTGHSDQWVIYVFMSMAITQHDLRFRVLVIIAICFPCGTYGICHITYDINLLHSDFNIWLAVFGLGGSTKRDRNRKQGLYHSSWSLLARRKTN